MKSVLPLTEELASFFADLQWESVPDAYRDEAKRVILDTLACIVPASKSEHGPMVREVANLFGECNTERQTVLGASYAYGRLANIMDFDESIALGYHFGPSAVTSALAIAQERDLSGKEFVLAVIAGYELGARVAQAMGPYGPSDPDGKIAYPETWGIQAPVVFGAVGAAAKALGLDTRLTAEAYAIAAALTVIPSNIAWFNIEGDLPNFKYQETGWLSMTGTFAALSAQRGARAFPGIMDGERGYLRMLGIHHYDRSKFVAGLGNEWRLALACYKPWPGMWWLMHILTPLDEIVSRHEFDADAIERVVVETSSAALTNDRYLDPQPGNFIRREFSYQHAVAMMLLNVSPGLGWLSPDNDVERRAKILRNKIEVVPHPDEKGHAAALSRGEGHSFENRVTVYVDGKKYQAESLYARGNAQAPSPYAWGNDDVAKKFRSQLDQLGLPGAQAVVDAVFGAERQHDLSVITNLTRHVFSN